MVEILILWTYMLLVCLAAGLVLSLISMQMDYKQTVESQ